jgi:hypothetical protein
VVSIDRPSLNIELRIFNFLNLKGHHLLNSINLFQSLTITKLALIALQLAPAAKKLVVGC